MAASLLVEAGLAVVIVNPRQVRNSAKANGISAKTDAIDAGVIARFAEAVKPDVVAESNRLKLANKPFGSRIKT